ncbi:MAG: hypothetical protein LN413_03865 [Candidatus Thermoplasmatota archaeon]|nr:hypothetical protein [Candidatus Thermoplasmatota archaeon]
MAVAAGGIFAGAAGLLEGFTVKMETSGFGKALGDMGRFNKAWEGMNKKLAPATNLWNKVTGAMNKGLGILKGMLAPLAIAGGLFLAFFLAGEAGRGVFGAFGQIIGAFSNILVSALMPAIEPILTMLADLVPIWQEIFGSPEWTATMSALGGALATLIREGLLLFIDLLAEGIRIMPIILPLFSDLAIIFADIVRWLRETGILQKVVNLFVRMSEVVIEIVDAGFIDWLERITPKILTVADRILDIAKAFMDAKREGSLFAALFGGIFNKIAEHINSFIAVFNAISLVDIPFIPLFETMGGDPGARHFGGANLQTGGIVARTGLALVHEGEAFSGVGPGASGLGGFPPIIFQGPVYFGTTDQAAVEDFVDQVSEELRRRWIAGISTPR